MNCTYCKKKIELKPTANARAKKNGGTPSDYTKLFTAHTACELQARAESVSALIARDYARG